MVLTQTSIFRLNSTINIRVVHTIESLHFDRHSLHYTTYIDRIAKQINNLIEKAANRIELTRVTVLSSLHT